VKHPDKHPDSLVILFSVGEQTSGAGTAPSRVNAVAKWVNTSVQFDSVTTIGNSTGSLATGGNITVLGTD